jgi:D-3-phosphoglycerate dehydrogenase
MKARMVRGKTIGLIGMGRTARGVVERLAGWEVRLQAHDPYVSQAAAPAGVTMWTCPRCCVPVLW